MSFERNGLHRICLSATVIAFPILVLVGCDFKHEDVDPNVCSDALSPSTAEEVCNGKDDDCDGETDEGLEQNWYPDGDGDGQGGGEVPVVACVQPVGYVLVSGDCDDTDSNVNSVAIETCDGIDNTCDGSIDEGLLVSWYSDADGDGYGSPLAPTMSCGAPEGYVENSLDCDDADMDINPMGEDACGDATDRNCDGVVNPVACDGFTLMLEDADALLVGEEPTNYAGWMVARAGDQNGDGLADFLVSAPYYSEARGAVYLVTGPADNGATLANAIRFTGGSPGDGLGLALDGGSDVNGDGIADIIMGAVHNGIGKVYLFYGPVTSDRSVSDADVSIGASNSDGEVGGTALFARDMNGDGLDDVMVGTLSSDGGTDVIHLFYGPDFSSGSVTQADATFERESCEAKQGVPVTTGDIDGDGYSDVILGDHCQTSSAAGLVYIFLGPFSGSYGPTQADAILLGNSYPDSGFGQTVAMVGDTNGDGIDDLLVGAPFSTAETGNTESGAVYLFSGPISGSLGTAEATARLVGEDLGGHAGYFLSAAGDLNSDGLADILVGTSWFNGSDPEDAAAYAVFGPISGVSSLRNADIRIVGGDVYDRIRMSAINAGDVNNDGLSDLLLGSYSHGANYSKQGGAFLFIYPTE